MEAPIVLCRCLYYYQCRCFPQALAFQTETLRRKKQPAVEALYLGLVDLKTEHNQKKKN